MAPAGPEIIECRQRLSQSVVWTWQRSFFDRQGVAAWRKGTVPHYVTSNPFIAQAYAQVVFGWLRDLTRATVIDRNQPLYIIELGAGCGRFGYHFLRAFFAIQRDSVLRDLAITYVMTDVAQSTIDEWRRHPQLAPFIGSGCLDFARFDAERDEELALIEAGRTLSADNVANPVAVIANYVFDGLAQDAFVIDDGVLRENLVTLSLPAPPEDPTDPALLGLVELAYEPGAVVGDGYYEPEFLDILRPYGEMLDDTNLLLPIGALRSLRGVHRLANGRLLLISGDKGYHRVADLAHRPEPAVIFHGSVSMAVNYHALGRYVEALGGEYLTVERDHGYLDICVAMVGNNEAGYDETRQAYALAVDQHGPDDFYTVKKSIGKALEAWGLWPLIAYLRQSGWDSKTFHDCLPVVLDQLDELTTQGKHALRDATRRVWDAYFWIGEDDDLGFALGMVCYGIGAFVEAVEFFEHSVRLWGPDPATLYNLAVNHAALNDAGAAMEYLERIFASNATYEPALVLRDELLGAAPQ